LNPNYAGGIAQLTHALIAHGQPQIQAGQEAVAMLYRTAGQQAQMLSYIDVFHTLMLVVFGAIPLLLLMQGPNARAKDAVA